MLKDLMNHEIDEGTPVVFIPTSMQEPMAAIILGAVHGATVATTWRGGTPYVNLPIIEGDHVSVIREDIFDILIESNGVQIISLFVILSCLRQDKLEEAEEIRKQNAKLLTEAYLKRGEVWPMRVST